jgi:hypothetical protein
MTSPAFHAFCEWLSVTALSELIKNVTWIIPSVQTVHIICISILFGAAAMVDFRVLGLAMRSQTATAMSRRLIPYIWGTLPVLLVTGAILIIGEPVRSLESPAFQIKMVLLAFAIALTLTVQKSLAADAPMGAGPNERTSPEKLLAVLSLAIWICIIFAGRYIAYSAG